MNEGEINFDAQSRPVPSVDFDWNAIEGTESREQLFDFVLGIKTETVRRVLLFLTADSDVKKSGELAHLLAYGLKIHPAESQIELARAMGISQPSASRRIKENVNVVAGFNHHLRDA